MEETREQPASGVSRNQNAVYVTSHDWASIATFMGPLVERVDDGVPQLQLLVVAPDGEVAAKITAATVRLSQPKNLSVLAATSVQRATRLLRVQPAHVIAGSPETIVALIRAATLKLDTVRMVCIAWADGLVGAGAAQTDDLETLMAEVPKDAARTIVVSEMSPAVEQFVERYARRGRRIAAPVADVDQPMQVEYVTTPEHGRLAALQRVIDYVDPGSALVFVRDVDRDAEVIDLLRGLGYGGPDAPVRAGVAAAPGTEVVVLFDLPASREELREAAGADTRVIALVQPRQLGSLRALAAGGKVQAITLPDSAARARDREGRIRAELSDILAKGQFGRELLALEPLLENHDGIEIAAATLQLLEQARATPAPSAGPAAAPLGAPSAAPARRAPAEMVRLSVNIGSRDGVRPADLVGAFANRAGVSSSELGKVDIRDSHSTIEVSPRSVDAIVDKVTGATIRGRRAVVRRDEERPRRPPPKGRPGGGGGGEGRGGRRA